MRRRRLLTAVGTGIGTGLTGCVTDTDSPTPTALRYSLPAFDGGAIPPRYTCDGAGVSPAVEIGRVPPETTSLALKFTYPNDIGSQVTLWTAWNVPPTVDRLPVDVSATDRPDALAGGVQGTNERGDIGYLPVCPPPGEPYEQWFTLYACRRDIELEPGASRDALEEELESATLVSKLRTATYERA
ncbi:YbhB/YbcL family Raf kinase inhibitor-like protein [Halobacteriales archaeon SW_8_65_20]|nr:MAG: YbhB/YbcL family Raf kinase inhibitor-like protein [Halobacteriales archaeon SW_8_65_20]